MVEPARLPDHMFGPVGEDLDAALRHLAGLDACEGEGRRSGRAAGIDRALHLHERPHAKALAGEPLVRGGGIGDRKRREMHAAIARKAEIELAAEQRCRRS